MNIGIVSGFFNPLHFGHIEYINSAKDQCSHLIAIVNNDSQVKLKGRSPFMDEGHRQKIMSNLKSVDFAIISRDEDSAVCKTLEHIKSLYPNEKLTFFNSGDRISDNLNNAEQQLCKLLNIGFVIIPLPKLYSSSQLVIDAAMEI